MLEQPLLDSVPGLQLLQLSISACEVVCELAATASAAACPLCGQPSQHVHSHYSRHPTDLPWSDCAVHYDLLVRRFFCDNRACPRRIFAERFGPQLRVYARRTTLLAERLQELGLTVGGAVGAVLATLVGTPVSASTILRLVRATAAPIPPTPRVLSIDDFAFRKGQTYGTILVDLEQHYPVDLLPDRDPATVAGWLRAHPGVAIISRDRATGYAQAAREGAPDALQIADRYHLLANLGNALKRLLDRRPGAMKAVTEQLAQLAAAALDPPLRAPSPQDSPTADADQSAPQMPLPTGLAECDGAPQSAPARPPTSPGAAVASESAAASRLAGVSPAVAQRFAAIKALQAKGHGQREIARQLALHRRTVQRNMVLDAPPSRAYGAQCQSKARAYLPYLRRRWAEGCCNVVVLWSELKRQGFSGSYHSIYRLVTQRLGQPRGTGGGHKRSADGAGPPAAQAGQPEPPEVRPLTARAGCWLLSRPPSELSPTEEQQRALLCTADPAIATAYVLGQRFTALIRDRQPEGLDRWIEDAKRSGVAELRNFAIGIERDHDAVWGAMSQSWSQGQTEGQVNRLKFIKRSGYGRMKFDLLRLRVLHRPKPRSGCCDHRK